MEEKSHLRMREVRCRLYAFLPSQQLDLPGYIHEKERKRLERLLPSYLGRRPALLKKMLEGKALEEFAERLFQHFAERYFAAGSQKWSSVEANRSVMDIALRISRRFDLENTALSQRDLAQEVAIGLFQKMASDPSLQTSKGRLWGLGMKIGADTVGMHHRRHAGRWSDAESDDLAETEQDTPGPLEGPPEPDSSLRAALDELGEREPKAREVIELRYFRNLSEDQIAGLLQCSRSTVSARAKKGRDFLRGMLASA